MYVVRRGDNLEAITQLPPVKTIMLCPGCDEVTLVVR